MFKLTVRGKTYEELQANLQAALGTVGVGSNDTQTKSVKTALKNSKAKIEEVDEEEEQDEEEENPAPKKGKVAPKKSKAAPVENDDEEEQDENSADAVLELAQSKIAEGAIDRVEVKKQVTKLGGAKISDLDAKSLVKLKKFLDSLDV